jgi:extracellular elastinolytic metalloproteinase
MRRQISLALVGAPALVAALVVSPTAQAEPGPATTANGRSTTDNVATSGQDKLDFFDSRTAGRSGEALQARADRMLAEPKAATQQLRAGLGSQGILEPDGLTGTFRQVTRTDGFLTGRSAASARSVALGYLSENRAALGLTDQGIASLDLRQDYVSIDGTHHLSFQQVRAGIPVFGNGVKANVTDTGRLVNITGSPLASVDTVSADPSISASEARSAAAENGLGKAGVATVQRAGDARRTSSFSNGDRAALVWFQTTSGLRLGWQTLVSPSSGGMFNSVVDATTGRVLYRDSLSDDANGSAWENYPGAASGGRQVTVDFTAKGWLPAKARTLAGPFSHTYTDVNDNDVADGPEEIHPTSGNFLYPFTPASTTATPCTTAFPCSWDPSTRFSWRTNASQNATQVFFFVNNFHDHLKAAPIGFTAAAGNFEGVDRVDTQPLDGASVANGLPDGGHIDNANMGTPPDGLSPRMQMFLFHAPGASYPDEDPFLAVNGGDEADVVYHEYTHGLSNRLVVDPSGNSTLGNIQAGSMGEAWSDWYAMDYLVGQGLFTDTAASGDLRIGEYVGAGENLIRTEPIDCAVGASAAACPGTPGAGSGGYTYGDFGRVSSGPEVHADGEIWGQTLWDLRNAIGKNDAESLVTRAMELSPANPSYLDMRNSILQADQVSGGSHADAIWATFAHRGMGYFAGSIDGDDTAVVESFSLPPAPGTPTANVTGTVTDADTGAALEGATVGFAGHTSGFLGDLSAVTDAAGHYTISGVFIGTYPELFARKAGYDQGVVASVQVKRNQGATANFALRFDWAALGSGGRVVDFTPPDYTPFGCGPDKAIDQSLGNGWGSDSDSDGATGGFVVTPRHVTVQLPQAVDIAQFAVDPGNTCGDAGSASTKDFTIETSTDGVNFTPAASGSFTAADRHRLNLITPASGSASGVTFFRFTMVNPQVPGDFATTCADPTASFSGCQFMDMSEIEVYGAPAG